MGKWEKIAIASIIGSVVSSVLVAGYLGVQMTQDMWLVVLGGAIIGTVAEVYLLKD